MCQSMVNIQFPTAEIRRGKKKKKKKKKKKNKPQHENIMVCPIPQGEGDHKEKGMVELGFYETDVLRVTQPSRH